MALSCRGWIPDINLKRERGDLFATEVSLKNNQKILYKFVINGADWVCDNSKPKEDDGKGNVNNVIVLGTSSYKPSSSSDTFGANNSQREFKTKDLKILRRQLNVVRNDISLLLFTFNLIILLIFFFKIIKSFYILIIKI